MGKSKPWVVVFADFHSANTAPTRPHHGPIKLLTNLSLKKLPPFGFHIHFPRSFPISPDALSLNLFSDLSFFCFFVFFCQNLHVWAPQCLVLSSILLTRSCLLQGLIPALAPFTIYVINVSEYAFSNDLSLGQTPISSCLFHISTWMFHKYLKFNIVNMDGACGSSFILLNVILL